MEHPLHPGETFDAWLDRIQPLRRAELDRRIREAGIRPLTREDLTAWPTLFASEPEHQAFLAWLQEGRHHHAG